MKRGPSEKIKTLDELAKITAGLKRKKKRVVQCHGVFDLLHPGHYRHFEAAKKLGDVLVVTVTADKFVRKGPGRPVYNEALRAEFVAALQCVDYVTINHDATSVEAIRRLKPDVYAKGKEYANQNDDLSGNIVREEKAVREAGGRIHFTDDIVFSSSALLNHHFDLYAPEMKKFLSRVRATHPPAAVVRDLERLRNLRVLVVGDAIIDQYIYSVPLGRPSKAMTLSVKTVGSEFFAGGALAAANHVAGFCRNVTLITVLGKNDSHANFIRSKLKKNVRPLFFLRPDTSTTVKKRYVTKAYLHKLFEEYLFDDRPISAAMTRDIETTLRKIIGDYDMVLVLDYGHGFLNQQLISLIAERAKFLAVNAQTNSANTGFNLITRYPRADYLCIDEMELRLALQDRYGNAAELIRKLAGKMAAPLAVVTLGHRGSIVYAKGRSVECPVFSTQVVDVIGAGDAYISITSLCASLGFPPELVGLIGNAAGALATRIVCNREAIEPVDLYKSLTTILK